MKAATKKQKAKTKVWYIKQHCFSRGDEWHQKLKMEFPVDENFYIIAAVMAEAAYFNKLAAEKDYQSYLTWKAAHPEIVIQNAKDWKTLLDTDQELPSPNFLYEIVTVEPVKLTKTGAAFNGEEWNCGIATTPEEANKLYDLSETREEGFETEEW